MRFMQMQVLPKDFNTNRSKCFEAESCRKDCREVASFIHVGKGVMKPPFPTTNRSLFVSLKFCPPIPATSPDSPSLPKRGRGSPERTTRRCRIGGPCYPPVRRPCPESQNKIP